MMPHALRRACFSPTTSTPCGPGLMAGPGPQSFDRRQAWYGAVYVQAICAQAGYLWTPTPSEGDVHSFDGTVAVHPGVHLPVQVKCTRHPLVRRKSYAIEDAWMENWSDLPLPGFFVVVVVPEDVSTWLQHDYLPDVRTIHNTSAYWTRIDPLQPDQKSIGVNVEDRLTADVIENWRATYYTTRPAYGGGTDTP